MITKEMVSEIKAVKYRCKEAGWLRKRWLRWWLPETTARAMIGILSNTIYIDGISTADFLTEPIWAKLRMHEQTHIWQRKRDGWFKFHLTYVSDWIVGVVEGLTMYLAYRTIRYEVEAREAEKYAIL